MRHMRQCCSVCKSQAPEATTCPPAACYGGHCYSIISGLKQGFCMFWNTSQGGVATYQSHDYAHLEMLQVYRCLIIVHSKLICELSFGLSRKGIRSFRDLSPTIQQQFPRSHRPATHYKRYGLDQPSVDKSIGTGYCQRRPHLSQLICPQESRYLI